MTLLCQQIYPERTIRDVTIKHFHHLQGLTCSRKKSTALLQIIPCSSVQYFLQKIFSLLFLRCYWIFLWYIILLLRFPSPSSASDHLFFLLILPTWPDVPSLQFWHSFCVVVLPVPPAGQECVAWWSNTDVAPPYLNKSLEVLHIGRWIPFYYRVH